MSIHHEVTVHCDGCGNWEQGNHGGTNSSKITRQRRREGWLIWRNDWSPEYGTSGPWRHLCPRCAVDAAVRARVTDECGTVVPDAAA